MNGRTRAISKLGCVLVGTVLAGWLMTPRAFAAPSPAPGSTANPVAAASPAAIAHPAYTGPAAATSAAGQKGEGPDSESADPTPEATADTQAPVPPAPVSPDPVRQDPASQPPVVQPTSAEPPVGAPRPAPAPATGPGVAPPAPDGPLPIIPPTASPPFARTTVPPPLVRVTSSPPGVLLPVPSGNRPTGGPTSSSWAPSAMPAGPIRHWHTGGPQDGHLPGFHPGPAAENVGQIDDSADESPHLLHTTTVTNQDQVAVITVVLIALAVLGLPLRRGLEQAVTGLAALLPRRRRRRLYGERWVSQHLTLTLVPATPTGAPPPIEQPATSPTPGLQFSWERGSILGHPADAR